MSKETSTDKSDEKSAPENNEAPVKHSNKKLLIRLKRIVRTKGFWIGLILILALFSSLYFYQRSRQAEQRLNDPNTASQKVIDQVVKRVSRHILLPSGEQPTLASVSDVTKVKGQPFFQNAENGDKVLIYTQARKAILYRPSKDIIVEVAPLNIDSSLQN